MTVHIHGMMSSPITNLSSTTTKHEEGKITVESNFYSVKDGVKHKLKFILFLLGHGTLLVYVCAFEA